MFYFVNRDAVQLMIAKKSGLQEVLNFAGEPHHSITRLQAYVAKSNTLSYNNTAAILYLPTSRDHYMSFYHINSGHLLAHLYIEHYNNTACQF